MSKKAILIVLTIVLPLTFYSQTLAWTEGTHSNLSKYAAERSIIVTTDYLKNIGFEKGLDQPLKLNGKTKIAMYWLKVGDELEDKSDWGFPIISGATTRSFNHFHNPLNTWEQAGLDDTWTGESSLLWAQDGANQQNFPDGDWSWNTIRTYYYLALTSRRKEEREKYFAKTFRGLGHQMHLIQDAAQPDHVRNDAHPEDTLSGVITPIGFEKWAGEEDLASLVVLKYLQRIGV